MTGARRVISTLIRRKPLGAVGGAIALGMVLVAIFADVLAPYDSTTPRCCARSSGRAPPTGSAPTSWGATSTAG